MSILHVAFMFYADQMDRIKCFHGTLKKEKEEEHTETSLSL